MVALVTKPPALNLRGLKVDLVDLHLATTGVERARWSQLRQRRLTWSVVFVAPSLVSSVVGLLLPYDAAQPNGRLREGVVRQQPLVREEVQDVALIELRSQPRHRGV